MSFSIDEWFVVALARTIRDREVVFHGFGSPCAQVAMHLARRTHARDMLLVEGATYAVNPDPPFIPPTGNDWSLQQGAAYRMRFEEFFDAAVRGDVDRMFLSGVQLDPYGNTNVTAKDVVNGIGSGLTICLIEATNGDANPYQVQNVNTSETANRRWAVPFVVLSRWGRKWPPDSAS